MNKILNNYMTVLDKISKAKKNFVDTENQPKLVAVSKNFEEDVINILLKKGHTIFGENRVQEAERKWTSLRNPFPQIELHLIGPLQSNKVKQALKVFDVIQTLDREKIAKKFIDTILSSENIDLAKKKFMIQVNTGNESQKSGISYNDVDGFYNYCTKEKKMNIVGLMAIPPNDNNTDKHFKTISELNASLNLKELSMGMSSDYKLAVKHKATFLRIGSSIFGDRI